MSHAPLRRVAAPLVAVVTAALLTSCAEPEPAGSASVDAGGVAVDEQAPSESPSPSVAAEPAVEKPERPAAMKKKDAEGAAAAAEYFLSLDQYMMTTGDTAEWQAMSHKTCEYCLSRLDQARTIAKRGDRYSGGRSSTRISTIYDRDPITGIWPMDVHIKEEPTKITDKTGTNVFSSDAAQADRRVELGRVDGNWIVVEVAPIPVD